MTAQEILLVPTVNIPMNVSSILHAKMEALVKIFSLRDLVISHVTILVCVLHNLPDLTVRLRSRHASMLPVVMGPHVKSRGMSMSVDVLLALLE